MSQEVQIVCQNILDKKDEGRRKQMRSYMAELMEDATDFSRRWAGGGGGKGFPCCFLLRVREGHSNMG